MNGTFFFGSAAQKLLHIHEKCWHDKVGQRLEKAASIIPFHIIYDHVTMSYSGPFFLLTF